MTIAEALAYGRPVVATGYGGNTQFMDESCAYVVPWRLAWIPRDAWPYDEGGLWADPDLDVASALLRAVREDPAEAEVASHKWLVRAGYIRRQAPGIFAWLPMGLRVRQNI